MSATTPQDSDPSQAQRESRFARIRRLKKWLRPLPRRSNVHRYPFLKYFAHIARKRSELWSIRPPHVIRALYAGTILTTLPLQGVQIPLALICALLCRANLPILVGLQFISNAFTLPPIYAADYYVGDLILQFFKKAPTQVINENPIEAVDTLSTEISTAIEVHPSTGAWAWIWESIQNVTEWLLSKGPYFFGAAMLGGLILGTLCGCILHVLYRSFIHPQSLDPVRKKTKY